MYVNAPDGLRVRELPDINASRITVLDDKMEVIVIKEDENNIDIDGINGKWTFIESNNIQGWVFGGYLSFESTTVITKKDILEEGFIEYEDENNFGFIIVTFATRDGSRSVKITEYFGENTEVSIPPTIQGLPVTLIEDAFNNKKLTSFRLPDSIFNIGYYSFANNNLSSIIIPNTVRSITDYAFENNQLKNIILSDNVQYLGSGAFISNQIASITLGANVNLARSEHMKEGIVFDNEFDEFYESNGSRAGTYILVNGNWIMQ